MKLTDIIRRPLITEKTTLLREAGRTVVFEVAAGATKVDIKRAVEKLLGSKVEAVRTSIAHGKFKRQGRFIGQRSDWKKAYVKLREGARDARHNQQREQHTGRTRFHGLRGRRRPTRWVRSRMGSAAVVKEIVGCRTGATRGRTRPAVRFACTARSAA